MSKDRSSRGIQSYTDQDELDQQLFRLTIDPLTTYTGVKLYKMPFPSDLPALNKNVKSLVGTIESLMRREIISCRRIHTKK